MYKYRPENVRTLALLLSDEAERESKQEYIANVLWMTLKCASMGSSEYPSFSEVFKPIFRVKEKTSEEIIADVLGFLEGDEGNGSKSTI